MRQGTPPVLLLLSLMVLTSVPVRAAQQDLDRRTTIDVSNAVPGDVFGSIARTMGCDLSISPEIRQAVTMRVSNVTVRTALTALSESLGCRWTLDGHTLRVELAGAEPGEKPGGPEGGVTRGVVGGVPGGVRGGVRGGISGGIVGGVPGGVKGGGADMRQMLERKTPADFHFESAPFRSVLEALGKIAELDVRLEEPDASRVVTVDLGGRTVLSALKTLREKVGFSKPIVFSSTSKQMLLKLGPSNPSNKQ